MQFVWLRMVNSRQRQFLYKVSTSHISTTSPIINKDTYLALDLASSMKNICSLFMFSRWLHIQGTIDQNFSRRFKLDHLIILHQWWHVSTIIIVTLKRAIFIQEHNSIIWTLRSNMPFALPFETSNISSCRTRIRWNRLRKLIFDRRGWQCFLFIVWEGKSLFVVGSSCRVAPSPFRSGRRSS